jgi:hypothetical protein
LVQADPLDEGRARVDQSHCHVVALRQAIGRRDAGVSPPIPTTSVLSVMVSPFFLGFGIKTPRDRSL